MIENSVVMKCLEDGCVNNISKAKNVPVLINITSVRSSLVRPSCVLRYSAQQQLLIEKQ